MRRMYSKQGGRWQHIRNDSPHPSRLTTPGFLALSEQGEAWAGLNGPHLSGILNKSASDMKLTRCSWSCWWQQFSLKSEAYNLSHKASGCRRLTSELWASSAPHQCWKLFNKREGLWVRYRGMENHIFNQVELNLVLSLRILLRSTWSVETFMIRQLLHSLFFILKNKIWLFYIIR